MPTASAPIKNCVNCGLRLVQPVVGRKRVYCSTLCRVVHWYQAHRQPAHLHHDWVEDGDGSVMPAASSPVKSCINCGLRLVQPAMGRKRVYCSTLCRVVHWYQAHRQPAHLHHDWVEDEDDVVCLTCGNTWQLVNGAGSYGEADRRR